MLPLVKQKEPSREAQVARIQSEAVEGPSPLPPPLFCKLPAFRGSWG